MIRIYLVQHGEAMPKEADPDRPLTEQGAQAVTRMACFLAGTGEKIVRILHSGKLRAEQTAQILARALVPGKKLYGIKHINPNDPVRDFADNLPEFGTGSMFVGHLPFMGKLVAHLLCTDETSVPVTFTPGSVACLQADDGGRWTLEWMLRPELIASV